MDFKVQQQVIVRRRVRSFPTTNEIRVGTIMSFSPDQQTATVSFSEPGRIKRAVVPVDQLEAVSSKFKRAAVQVNPAFRQIV